MRTRTPLTGNSRQPGDALAARGHRASRWASNQLAAVAKIVLSAAPVLTPPAADVSPQTLAIQFDCVVVHRVSRRKVVEDFRAIGREMRPAARRLVRTRGRRGAEFSARHGRVVPLVPRAKIAPPTVPDEFVVRKQLLTDLDDASDVVAVCAPAGFGKTMLLAEWVRTSPDVVTAWVDLDRDDNDPRRLWSTVAAAVAASPAVSADSRLARPWRWPTAPPEYLAELIEALGELERPVRLVLDDAHELVGGQALHGLDVLVRHRPAGLVLVLSSRYPLSAVSRLSPTGTLRELRADQLRFSLGETAALLDRAGVHPATRAAHGAAEEHQRLACRRRHRCSRHRQLRRSSEDDR